MYENFGYVPNFDTRKKDSEAKLILRSEYRGAKNESIRRNKNSPCIAAGAILSNFFITKSIQQTTEKML